MDDQVYFHWGFSEQAGEASVVFAKDIVAGGFEAAVDGDGCFRRGTQGDRVFAGEQERRRDLDGNVLRRRLQALRCVLACGAMDDAAEDGGRDEMKRRIRETDPVKGSVEQLP
jgi:hypothetical protein